MFYRKELRSLQRSNYDLEKQLFTNQQAISSKSTPLSPQAPSFTPSGTPTKQFAKAAKAATPTMGHRGSYGLLATQDEVMKTSVPATFVDKYSSSPRKESDGSIVVGASRLRSNTTNYGKTK